MLDFFNGSASLYYLMINTTGQSICSIMDNGGAAHTITGSTTLSANVNYFMACIWDGSNIHLWLGTSSSSMTEDATVISWSGTPKTATSGENLYIGDINGYYPVDGYLDSLFVFKNKSLSQSDLDSIRVHKIDGSN